VYIEFSYPEFISDQRDRSVIRFYLPPKTGQPHVHDLQRRGEHPAIHVAILWDRDRDTRMVATLAALYLRKREMLEQLVGVAESRGKIDFWCRSAEDAKELRGALDEASAAISFGNAWKANVGQVVPCTSTGAVDWEKLDEKDPQLGALRSAAKGHGLGVITPRGAL
jgi:hypothetical protein